jgi:hypothetical protein
MPGPETFRAGFVIGRDQGSGTRDQGSGVRGRGTDSDASPVSQPWFARAAVSSNISVRVRTDSPEFR